MKTGTAKTVQKGKGTSDEGGICGKSRRSWTAKEIEDVLQTLLDIQNSGKTLEKPTANAFYEKILQRMSLEDCTVSQIKHQVANLKKKYQKTIDWRRQTGQGVLEDEGEAKLKDVIFKRCPHFDLLDELFGERVKMNPPFTLDSSSFGTSPELPATETTSTSASMTEDAEGSDTPHFHSPPAPPTGTAEIPANRTKRNNKRKADCSTKALSDLVQIRFDMHEAELSFSKEKWEYEKIRLENTQSVEQKKLEFEQEMQIKKLELERQIQKDKLEIEKYKIDQEMKLKLEIAKLEAQNKA